MRLLVLTIAFLVSVPALAQQQPAVDSAFLQKALSAMQAQRNNALDEQVGTVARAAVLADENAKLKAEIEELKKKAAPSEPAK